MQSKTAKNESDPECPKPALWKVVSVVFDVRIDRYSDAGDNACHQPYANCKRPGVVNVMDEGAADKGRGHEAESTDHSSPKLPTREPRTNLGEEEGIAQFVARFPGARSVAVVGSFNDWRAGSITLEDRDHDGVWRGVVVLPAGAHEYMFVVDGERWVADPLAGRYVEDDFGRENSLLIVRPVLQ